MIGISEAALADLEEMWIGLEDAKVEMRDHQFHVRSIMPRVERFGVWADSIGCYALCADE